MHLSSYTATPQQQLTSYAILLRFHWLRLHWILLFLWISTLFLKQVAGVISQPNFSISLEQSIKSINWPSELFKSSNKDSLTLNVPTWCLKKMSLDLKKKQGGRQVSRTSLAHRCNSAFASVGVNDDIGSFKPGPWIRHEYLKGPQICLGGFKKECRTHFSRFKRNDEVYIFQIAGVVLEYLLKS